LKGVPLLLEEEAERSEDNVATLLLLSTEEQASRAANDSPAFAADDFLSMPACTIAPAHSARERERERERETLPDAVVGSRSARSRARGGGQLNARMSLIQSKRANGGNSRSSFPYPYPC